MSRTKKSKRLCVGCRDNFYNGNNNLGVKECWDFESARIKRIKFIPLNQRPPWDQPAVTTLSCYRKKGYMAVGPDQRC